MSFATWKKRVAAYAAGAPITNSLINQLRSLFAHSFMVAAKPECAMLEDIVIYENGSGPNWAITPEQAEKGLKWMQRSNVNKHFASAHTRIIEDFDRFTFEGLLLGWEGMGQSANVVYRVHSKSHGFFDYTAPPWQQGTKEPFRIIQVCCQKGR